MGRLASPALLAALVAATVSGAHAQDDYLPATEVSPTSEFAGETDITFLYIEDYPDFAAEVERFDAADVFYSGPTPDGSNGLDASLMIGIFEDFEQALATYRFINAGALPDIIAESNPEDDTFVSYQSLDRPDRTLHIFTFVRDVDGERADERCMARFIVDAVYRGLGDAQIPVMACSRAIGTSE